MALIGELVESVEIRFRDATHVWIARGFPGRADNLVCVAAVLEDSVVIKTVMHHFAWEPEA